MPLQIDIKSQFTVHMDAIEHHLSHLEDICNDLGSHQPEGFRELENAATYLRRNFWEEHVGGIKDDH